MSNKLSIKVKQGGQTTTKILERKEDIKGASLTERRRNKKRRIEESDEEDEDQEEIIPEDNDFEEDLDPGSAEDEVYNNVEETISDDGESSDSDSESNEENENDDSEEDESETSSTESTKNTKSRGKQKAAATKSNNNKSTTANKSKVTKDEDEMELDSAPKKMTARQRAKYEGDEQGAPLELLSLPMGPQKKIQRTAEEEEAARERRAQQRRAHQLKMIEKEKSQVVAKLVNRSTGRKKKNDKTQPDDVDQASKDGGKSTGADVQADAKDTKKEFSGVRYVSNNVGSYLTIPVTMKMSFLGAKSVVKT